MGLFGRRDSIEDSKSEISRLRLELETTASLLSSILNNNKNFSTIRSLQRAQRIRIEELSERRSRISDIEIRRNINLLLSIAKYLNFAYNKISELETKRDLLDDTLNLLNYINDRVKELNPEIIYIKFIEKILARSIGMLIRLKRESS